MGVPKLFQFIWERYPNIVEVVDDAQMPDFDNFYIDMNGIFHMCSHANTLVTVLSDEEIFKKIFHFIDVLLYIVKPKKLLFLAVDGVAPVAKMNHQRGRRFMRAREVELMEKKLKSKGEQVPEGPRFDSNCISPGTTFMVKLQEHLKYYVTSRISSNPTWQKLKVILSGHEVPGEGEHKVMDFIRYMKTQPEYDPYGTHCFYGADADLMLLSLCTHERNFTVVREEVLKSQSVPKIVPPEKQKFFLVHLNLLKEYIDLEFSGLKSILPFEYDLEKIVDDWVLMTFILGNDFIPHLPNFHIAKGAFPILFKNYIEVLPTLSGYMNENGYLNLPRFQIFLDKLSKYELEMFEETYANLAFLEEKSGKKSTPETNESNNYVIKPRDPQLEMLVRATNEALGFIDGDSGDEERDLNDDDEEDTFLKEFYQHKRDYYTNKLKCPEVNEDVLKSQAECYVRGIQWILHYYYHGCRSWSWYYPYHYAPCTSDIVNFSNVNLDFELGKPFLPYEQLMAILPPSSNGLVPQAYRKLMTSPDSSIIEFYPEDFETDLNGKRFEWEAVVLLPYVDWDKLLNAMKDCNSNLTPEEKSHNRHGPMGIYTFTEENLGTYKAPKHFSDVETNHALVKNVWREEMTVNAIMSRNIKVDIDPDVRILGFPTFKDKRFQTSLRKGEVRVFLHINRGESLFITLDQEEKQTIDALAKELLGKTVYANWPHLIEVRVIALSDKDHSYALSDGKIIVKDLPKDEKWNLQVSALSRQYSEKRGIDIGRTDIVVYANRLEGFQIRYRSPTEPVFGKAWSNVTELFPLQTIIKSIKFHQSRLPKLPMPDEVLSVGSTVFMLGYPYYGCMGTIVQAAENTKSDRLVVKFETVSEPKFNKESLIKCNRVIYYPGTVAAKRAGIKRRLLLRLCGDICVRMSVPGQYAKKCPVINIGLSLKYANSKKEMPGYTRKRKDTWMFSEKAIKLVMEYVAKFPLIIDGLADDSRDVFMMSTEELFPTPDGAEEVQKLVDWLSSLECAKNEMVPCGSEYLEKESIKELEEIIDGLPRENSTKTMFVKPHLLFTNQFVSAGIPPVVKAEHRLLDRIIASCPNHTVPIGLRGYIVGIYQENPQSNYMYDIVYDEPFPSGMTLNCSPGRGYRSSNTTFINISHGERVYQVTKQSKPISTDTSIPDHQELPEMLNKERPPSAFAGWNNYPPSHLPSFPGKEESFKCLWSYLEKVKTQDETTALKKILKIGDDNIEENVKDFFNNISKSAESSATEMENVKVILHKSQKQHRLQLLNYFQTRNLSQPKFQTFVSSSTSSGLVCRVSLPDGRTFLGCPCPDEESARESAALQALTALGEIQIPGVEQIMSKDNDQIRKILENRARLEKGLSKLPETESAVKDSPRFPLKSPNDKITVRGNKLQQQQQQLQHSPPNQSNHHPRNNVPHVLPTPPLQWCRQYKTMDQYKRNPNKSSWRTDGGHSVPSGRFQNENYSYDVRSSRSNDSGNYRNHNWRQEEKARGQQSVQQQQQQPSPPQQQQQQQQLLQHEAHNNNRRYKINRDTQQDINLRPDSNYQSRTDAPNDSNQTAPNGTSKRPSTGATKFIPLQALSTTRNRGVSKHSVTTPKQVKESNKVVPSKAPVKLMIQSHEVKVSSPSNRVQRKPKIAAKFDGAWDPQG